MEIVLDKTTGFTFYEELKEITISGNIDFNSKYSAFTNKKLIIPVYGIYKIDWGFSQNSLSTFYKDAASELSLYVNNYKYEITAVISKETKSYHAVKSTNKSITLLLREKDSVFLNAVNLNSENLLMNNVYLKIEKLEVEDKSGFGYDG
ncbi:hypothetical protein [Polaribacter sp. OB-PA-B3]